MNSVDHQECCPSKVNLESIIRAVSKNFSENHSGGDDLRNMLNIQLLHQSIFILTVIFVILLLLTDGEYSRER